MGTSVFPQNLNLNLVFRRRLLGRRAGSLQIVVLGPQIEQR